MKLYALYSDSHRVLFDEWFRPSLKDNFEIVALHHPQDCAAGEFMKPGWLVSMIRKVDLILRAIDENPGKPFVHADVDIQFFRPCGETLLKLLEDRDMVIQRESRSGTVCPGFFAAVGNEKNRRLWKAVRAGIIAHDTKHDQDLLNEFLFEGSLIPRFKRRLGFPRNPQIPNPFGLKWNYLPDTFFTPGLCLKSLWEPGTPLPLPEGILLHHANWTLGIEQKIAQLRQVRDAVTARP